MPTMKWYSTLGSTLLLISLTTAQMAHAQQKTYQFKFDLKEVVSGIANQAEQAVQKINRSTPEPQQHSDPEGKDEQAATREASGLDKQVKGNQTVDSANANADGNSGKSIVAGEASSEQKSNSMNVVMQLGEPAANLFGNDFRRYFKRGAGVDTYEFSRFEDRISETALFPEVDKTKASPQCDNQRIGAKRNLVCDKVVRGINTKKRILRNTGEFLKTVKPGADSRFDQHMSALVGVAFEIGASEFFDRRIDIGRAVAWYESTMNINHCTDMGTSRSYSCNRGRYLARARLGFMCIAGHGCTSDVQDNKDAWPQKGVELIGALVDEVKRWDSSGGDANDEILEYVHYFAIFIPPDIQLKLANIRANKVRDLFVGRGTIHPHPDWLTNMSAIESSTESYSGILCVPPPSKANETKWNSREYDLITPKALPGAWMATGIEYDWLSLSAKSGYKPAVSQLESSRVYYDSVQKIHTSQVAETEKEKVAKLNARWERDLAGKLRDWRRSIKPNINVRWADGEAAGFTVGKVSGNQAISILYERDVCVAGTDYYRGGVVVDTECHRWRKENFRYKADIGKLLPDGYDGNGVPVNSGGRPWIGRVLKVVDGELIETPAGECEAARNVQNLWQRKYGAL